MLRRWTIRLRALFRGHAVEAEYDEELRYHLERQIERNVAYGMAPEEARRAALRDFGNPLLLREQARETWRWRRLDELASDVRHAVRVLRDRPGFTAVAVLSFGFGIGAATTFFSVIDALDFRPLPYAEPDRLVWLTELTAEDDPGCSRCPWATSVPTAADWWTRTRSFEALGLHDRASAYLQTQGFSEGANIGRASPGFFDVLGAPPSLGREFVPEDTVPGADPVVILSHETWRIRFQGDPAVLGTRFEYYEDPTLQIAQAATVVGVLPEGFRFWLDFPFWMPLAGSDQRNFPRTVAVARLRPGIEAAAARAELRAVHAGLSAEYPDAYRGRGADVRDLRERIRARAGEGRGILFGITLVVLLVAVLNVAGLFTARAAARHMELTVRHALGASRGRLVRMLLAEGVTLGLAGGLLGIATALWGVRIANLSFDMERYGPAAHVDHRVLAFALGISVIVGLLAPLLAAGGVGRTDLYGALRQPTESGPQRLSRRSRPGGRPLSVLLVGQISAGLVLLTAAGVLGSEYLKLRHLDLGYDPENVYEAGISGPPEYRGQPELLRLEAEDARTRVRAIPGVASASLRFHSAVNPSVVRPDDFDSPEDLGYVPVVQVDADYFQTLGIPTLAGTTFSEENRRGAPPVAVLNRSAAAAFWPGQPAIGMRVFVGDSESEGEWLTVVGIVEDVERGELVRRHWPRLYRPLAQGRIYHPFIGIHFRAAEDDPDVLPLVEATLREALGRPIRAATSHEERLSSLFFAQRTNALVLNVFAAFALLLAAMGIYGSVSYAVTRRTREVGVRMALGARRASILALCARDGAILAVLGVVLGSGGSFVLTRVLRSLVSATSVTDPWVFAGAALSMGLVVLAATYLPARRATAVDPVIALRSA